MKVVAATDSDSSEVSTAAGQSPPHHEEAQPLMLECGLGRKSLYPPEVGLHILGTCEAQELSDLVAKFPVLAPLAGIELKQSRKPAKPTMKRVLQEAKERKLKEEPQKVVEVKRPVKTPRPRVDSYSLYEDIGLLSKLRKIN